MKKIYSIIITAVILVFTGTIHHVSEEGGFYAIEGDDGTEYKPLNLTSGYQVEGARVKVYARKIRGNLLTHGWGVPIRILDIEKSH